MPEPVKALSVPPLRLISDATKSVVVSEVVKFSVIDASLDVSPLVTVGDNIETVGEVLSNVQLKTFEAELETLSESVN